MRAKLVRSIVFAVFAFVAAPSLYAQTGAVPDKDLQLLRKDLRSMKKQLVAANLPLTDVEAQKFWPVYDQYTAETVKLYDARYAIVKDYADHINNLTDEQATSIARRWSDADAAAIQLRQKHFPLFEKVIGGKKTALFFQIDRRLALMIDLQLASEIPLVQP